jgi:putative DNA primase/helicase
MLTYAEKSPSGRGVRIIFKAPGFVYDKKRYYINNQKLGLEIYISGCTQKFVTITGDVIEPLPVKDCYRRLP